MKPRDFEEFCLSCDRNGIDPLTTLRGRLHNHVDQVFDPLEEKYREGREGKSWADVANDVYVDVKGGYDQLSKVAADWYYGNP